MECAAADFSVVPYEFGKTFFPSQVNGKLNTLEFLEASKGIVKLVDKLGKVFSPLSNDISCNIEKIKKCYDKNPEKYVYLEDLILSEKSENEMLSVEGLMWLRRALNFILVFFENIINDKKEEECLKEHMTSAYSQTLEPYHGWITRNLFKFFKNLVPNRSDLIAALINENKEEGTEKLIGFLQAFFQTLALNVQVLTKFYLENNLECDRKV